MILFITFILIIFSSLIGIIKNKNNLLFIILFVEMILITLTSLFSLVYFIQGSYFGQVYGLYILTIAAVETAIIISIVVQYYRYRGNININIINYKLKLKSSI
jgi:NADH:ubiquinone oxidoreductase subunit K